MSTGTADYPQGQNNEVVFDSSNIGKKEAPDYFQGRVRKRFVRDFIKSAFEGKQRYITIGIITVVAIAIVVFVLWLTIWSRTGLDSRNADNSEGDWSQQLIDIKNDGNSIFNSDSENSFTDAINYFDTLIEAEKDNNRLFDIKLAKAAFLNNSGSAQMAIDDLAGIDESALTDSQRYQLYLTLSFSYRQIGDEEYAKIYDEQINALPSSVTQIGG